MKSAKHHYSGHVFAIARYGCNSAATEAATALQQSTNLELGLGTRSCLQALNFLKGLIADLLGLILILYFLVFPTVYFLPFQLTNISVR
jgi:hypothetical protein